MIRLKNLILESDSSVQSVANEFYNEYTKKFKFISTGINHLNCAWVTKEFYNWAKNKGYSNLEIMYFVEPKPELVAKLKQNGILSNSYDSDGEAHIVPIYNGYIIDYTIGQFTGRNEKYKITPKTQWKSVYEKYGYGTNNYDDTNDGIKITDDSIYQSYNIQPQQPALQATSKYDASGIDTPNNPNM